MSHLIFFTFEPVSLKAQVEITFAWAQFVLFD